MTEYKQFTKTEIIVDSCITKFKGIHLGIFASISMCTRRPLFSMFEICLTCSFILKIDKCGIFRTLILLSYKYFGYDWTVFEH